MTKKIPDEVRDKYPGIAWREMTGMRNKLIHDYFGVNLEVIWKTVTEDMPKLIPLIKQVIEDQTSAQQSINSFDCKHMFTLFA